MYVIIFVERRKTRRCMCARVMHCICVSFILVFACRRRRRWQKQKQKNKKGKKLFPLWSSSGGNWFSNELPLSLSHTEQQGRTSFKTFIPGLARFRINSVKGFPRGYIYTLDKELLPPPPFFASLLFLPLIANVVYSSAGQDFITLSIYCPPPPLFIPHQRPNYVIFSVFYFIYSRMSHLI